MPPVRVAAGPEVVAAVAVAGGQVGFAGGVGFPGQGVEQGEHVVVGFGVGLGVEPVGVGVRGGGEVGTLGVVAVVEVGEVGGRGPRGGSAGADEDGLLQRGGVRVGGVAAGA